MASYSFGQAIRLASGTITGDTGAEDPATLVLTITLPDSTTAIFNLTGTGAGVFGQLTKDSVGNYHLDYLPPQSGRYYWRFLATGPNAAAEGGFEVAASGMTNLSLVDLDEWMAFAQLTSNTGPGGLPELQGFLNGAHALIDWRVGGILPAARSETVDGGWCEVALSRHIISMTSVLEVAGCQQNTITEQPLDGDPTTWTSYGFTRDGMVLTRRANGWVQNWAPGRRNIVVNYTSGLTLTPSETDLIKEAIKELTTHFFTTQQGNRRAKQTEWSPTMAFALPNAVREKIAPWDIRPRAV